MGQPELRDADRVEASIAIPKAQVRAGKLPAEPKTLHVILEVTDQGSPPLTRYQRVILTIAP